MAAAVPSMISRSVRASPLSSLLGKTRGMKIASAKTINDGKSIDVEFTNGTAYRFHTSWMKDSSPSNVGSDFYRKTAKGLFETENYIASEVKPSECGTKLQVAFMNGSDTPVFDEYVGTWLHAFAPQVGKPLHETASAAPAIKGTGSLLDNLYKNRKGWGKDLEMPKFTAEELLRSEAKQVEFLERCADPGCAQITDLPPPESLDNMEVGKPMESLITNIIGRLNQHPVRTTRYGVMHTRAKAAQAGADYDHSNPLSMHTDHSVYNGTPGYLQFLYQAQGHVQSRVCDGLAIAEYVREHHPEEYKLLTEVQITHSSRNNIYAKNGDYRADAEGADGATFELVHTHPVIQLDEHGLFEKVVQSETKRGVCAMPFDTYHKFMGAYRMWTQLVEDERFIKHFDWPENAVVVTNNWRVLHGRASVPPGMARTMCFGYVQRPMYENRYRLLKQLEMTAKDPLMDHKWLTRLPNQVLSQLVHR